MLASQSQRYILTTFTTASLSSSPSPSLSPRCSLKTNSSTSPHLPPFTFIKSFQPPAQPLESVAAPQSDASSPLPDSLRHGSGSPTEGDDEEISGVEVPRQKYIPVSKAELLDAITAMLLDSQQDVSQFHLLSTCLDSILHAEHKSILEEMRADYSLSESRESEGTSEVSGGSDREVVINGNKSDLGGDGYAETGHDQGNEDTDSDKPISFNYSLDLTQLRNLLGSSSKDDSRCSNGESRVAVATRFQRAFMQLLRNAQFEELSARDLMLTSALNTDYLLTLPIYVDWKKASESNAIIFRRGYATERQKGLLIVEKLDYIQSKLLQIIFFIISKPLGTVGTWINEALKNASQIPEVQNLNERMKLWLKELSAFRRLYSNDEDIYNNMLGVDQLSDRDLPIWLAAQRAVSRYEGLLSSAGPRGRLFKKLLTRIGLIPPTPETTFQLDSNSDALERYLRPIFLSRISLSDIWRPTSRKFCGNNVWKMIKTSISILLSQSVLQEPAFQELILLYTDEMGDREKEIASVPSLQLKIYKNIPIPELPVIFPHKKLSFRILDTVRLDIATILGLSAYFINYKFEDILSLSAVFLDVVATGALILYTSRVVLGYKQTWDRYQLLVNRTLYEKTLASGFGSIHFLLDASEQQQYKEAILAYAMMLKANKGQFFVRQTVGDECERFLYDVLKKKVEMPIDKAMETLIRLGLVTERDVYGRLLLQAVPCPDAYEALKERWNGLLS